jgi:nanoRNase/pAp phosphatase (c-di-AMP/oligoRNAs hydrolase)
MNNTPSTQTKQLIEHAQNILIIGPEKWSADSAAGVIGLFSVLKKLDKNVRAVAPESVPENISFLPNNHVVGHRIGKENDFVITISTRKSQIKNIQSVPREESFDLVISSENGMISAEDISFKKHVENFDLVITVGADSFEDCGSIFQESPELFSETPSINISANPSNEFFGKVNLVNPAASSVCEVLADFTLNYFPEAINEQIATIFLTGILSETESFLSSTTTAKSLTLAAQLQEIGASQSEIIEHLFKEKTFANLRVLGRMMNNLQLDPIHHMAWSMMTHPDFELTETEAKDIDGWSDNLLRHTNGADFLIFFVAHPDKTVVQLRSATGNLDFSDIGQQFPDTEIVKNGINVLFEKQSITDIKGNFLRKCAYFQEQNLQLEPGLPIQKTEIMAPLQYKKIDTDPMILKKETGAPLPPENLPFDAPLRPDAISFKQKKATQNTVLNESVKKEEGKPSWME